MSNQTPMNEMISWDFEGWFSFRLPEDWECVVDGDIYNIYSTADDAKGALQISLYHRLECNAPLQQFVLEQLARFVERIQLDCMTDTKGIVNTQDSALAHIEGISGNSGNFFSIWTLANNAKFLLITYNSSEKTEEVRTAESIVGSIRLK
jgi:hypothetical protein